MIEFETPNKCEPDKGYHVFSGEKCQCGERDRIVWSTDEPPALLGLPEPARNVVGCARCGEDHTVRFRELSKPIVVGEATLTHWAVCPTTSEPILMRFVEVPPWDGQRFPSQD